MPYLYSCSVNLLKLFWIITYPPNLIFKMSPAWSRQIAIGCVVEEASYLLVTKIVLSKEFCI